MHLNPFSYVFFNMALVQQSVGAKYTISGSTISIPFSRISQYDRDGARSAVQRVLKGLESLGNSVCRHDGMEYFGNNVAPWDYMEVYSNPKSGDLFGVWMSEQHYGHTGESFVLNISANKGALGKVTKKLEDLGIKKSA